MEEENDFNNAPAGLKKPIYVLVNPRSGRGRAAKIASELCRQCGDYPVQLLNFEGAWPPDLSSKLHSAWAAIVVGGDGTLAHLLPVLSESGVPFYLASAGNENLFCREFFSSAGRIPQRMAERICCEVPIASANGRLFATMASIGLDAEVIRDIAKDRTSPIGHAGYIGPVLRAAWRHRPPELTIAVDGKPWINSQSGFFIAANTKQYACRIPLAPSAVPDSETLLGVFIPYRSVLFYASWLPRALAGRPYRTAQTIRAREFSVAASSPCPVQSDGEYLGDTPVLIRREKLAVRIIK